jgi:hypothetical protein
MSARPHPDQTCEPPTLLSALNIVADQVPASRPYGR